MSSAPSPSAALPASFSRHTSYSNRSRKRVSTVFSPRSAGVVDDVFRDSSRASCLTAGTAAVSFPSSAASFRSAPTSSRTTACSSTSTTRSGGVAKRPSPRVAPPPEVLRKAAAGAALPKAAVQTAALGSAGTVDTSRYRLLFEDEYQEEVIEHMHHMERVTMPDLVRMELQPELKPYMKPYLVDFLIEIHQQFRLRPEVLYLAMNIVDRYVSKRVVFKKHYQLVGCAALWIAAKFEDAKERVPSVETLRDMCCNAYDESAFIQMEGHILSTIGWCVGHPTAEAWLRLSCMGTSVEDAETQHVTRFIMELTLFAHDFTPFAPSALAAGALLVARFLLGRPRRVVDERDPSVEVAFLLDVLLGERLETVSEIVTTKYSHAYYNRASIFVREEYLRGRRFELHVPSAAPSQAWHFASSELPLTVPSHLGWSGRSSFTASSSAPSLRRSDSAISIESDMPETPTFSPYSENVPCIVGSADSSRQSSFCVPTGGSLAPLTAAKVSSYYHSANGSGSDHGFAVQEPRIVFSSIQGQARANNVDYSNPPSSAH